MSVRIVRRRAVPVLVAAGAAVAAMLPLAVPAGASTGPPEISPEQAGYTATGAQFSSVQATIYLRNPAQYASEVGQYSHSVQLWSSGLVAVLGVSANTSGSGYTTYVRIFDPTSHRLLASDPGAEWCSPEDVCNPGTGSFPVGDTVVLSFSYFQGAALDFTISDGPGLDTGWFFRAGYPAGLGVSFTQARVGTEFGSTPWANSYSYTPPAKPVMVARYTNVSLTSYTGHTATLWSWWVHRKLRANTGQQSGSVWVAAPTDLTDGGASFQTQFVPQGGQGAARPGS